MTDDLQPFAPPGASPTTHAPPSASPYAAPMHGPWAPGHPARPARPSAHLAWVVAAWIVCWPLGIAAHLARDRALSAHDRGDAAELERYSRRTRTLGVWAVVVGSVWALAVLAGGVAGAAWLVENEGVLDSEDFSPSIEDEADPLAQVYPDELTLGDCFDYPAEGEALLDLRPCADPHSSEVFAEATVPDDAFPGDLATEHMAERYCFAEHEALARTEDPGERTYVWFYSPSEESWQYGDRIIVCVADTEWEGDTVTGAWLGPWARAAEESFANLEPGHCLDPAAAHVGGGSAVSVPLRPCDRFHAAEVFGVVPLPDTEYPGDSGQQRAGREVCRAELARLGLAHLEDGRLEVGSLTPGAAHWGSPGFSVAACYLASTEDFLDEPIPELAAAPGS
ncbi:septum formation family protein [Antribacter gilvus]|uniref:septum formation family protein n=1 Tax=Antribacter gilvus TaxID=2304675 RepID=UPI000F7B5E79|nr:septum formation family protein [Antribacter gilvus]